MAKFYFVQIILGKITINDVPDRWKEATRKLLTKEEQAQ